MQDGSTRRLRKHSQGADAFFLRNQATLVVVSGAAAGSEFQIQGEYVTLGRGVDADIKLEDPSMSAVHAAFETSADTISLRDLDSSNGVRVNGAEVKEIELKHGDKLAIGEYELQLIIEERDPPTRIMSFPGE